MACNCSSCAAIRGVRTARVIVWTFVACLVAVILIALLTSCASIPNVIPCPAGYTGTFPACVPPEPTPPPPGVTCEPPCPLGSNCQRDGAKPPYCTPLPPPTPDPPPPPPPALECVDPGENVEMIVGARVTMDAEVDRAVVAVAGARPDLLQDGKVVDWPQDGTKQDAAAAPVFQAIAAELADKRICSFARKDALEVWDADFSRLVEFHLINFGGGRVGRASDTFRRASRVKEPIPAPIPEPEPTVGCPVTFDADHYLEIRLKRQDGARAKVDATPFYCGFPLASLPNCGTKCCTLGVDGGPAGVACEAVLFGVPFWDGTGYAGPTDNPFTVFVQPGTVRACSSMRSQFCGSLEVK